MMNISNLIVSSVFFIVLDYLYLSSQKNYFNKLFLQIQGSKINFKMEGAILCYIALILALNYFILNDKDKNLCDAFLLGFFIYVVYETTNYATLNKWPFEMVIMDSLWGGILFLLTVYLRINRVLWKLFEL